MIKKEDLMIGDWVICKKGFVTAQQITAIWANGVVTGVKWDFDEIDPVPLTREILEKNGFRCKEEYEKYEWHEGNCEVWVILCSNEYGEKVHVVHIEDRKHSIPICYHNTIISVHELQHALRLCGIKKEIIV